MGGVLVFEIVHQERARDGGVDSLLPIDPPRLGLKLTAPADDAILMAFVADLAPILGVDPGTQPDIDPASFDDAEAMLGAAAVARALPRGTTTRDVISLFRRYRETLRAHIPLLNAYRPGRLTGAAQLFEADPRRQRKGSHADWTDHIERATKTILPGEHHAMLHGNAPLRLLLYLRGERSTKRRRER